MQETLTRVVVSTNDTTQVEGMNRRSFLDAAAEALSASALMAPVALAQSRGEFTRARSTGHGEMH